MQEKINLFHSKSRIGSENEDFTPIFFDLKDKSDHENLNSLISMGRVEIHDTIHFQLIDLVKCRNPSIKSNISHLNEEVRNHLNGRPSDEYGKWVYYPWAKKLVHLLDKDEFIEVRTNRNKNKITGVEQEMLSLKKIGVIGLSVGSAIATTMAMERICGELKLADFDSLDLSNLNRLKSSVFDIGINKTVLCARQIAEIDPYIKITTFKEGINASNIDEFLSKDGKLDLLVEECDTLSIKLLARQRSKQFKIPVLMDTNDRGMIDIERYDLDENYPILHGLVPEMEFFDTDTVSPSERLEFVLKILGKDSISARLSDSIKDMGKTLCSWPQLSSSVELGAGSATTVARRILLGQSNSSGREYVDVEKLF